MLSVKNLSFTYSGSNTPALNQVNLEFRTGEFVAITGHNGSGKSTLIKTLLGIIPNYIDGELVGHVAFSDKVIHDTLSIASKIGILLQDPDSQITNLTTWEEVIFGLENMCLPIEDVICKGKNSLEQMDLTDSLNKPTHQLSGGQKQRLTLASLLAMQPKVLILDEPLANLDNEGIKSVIETLEVIRSQVDLIIVSSHNLQPFWNLMSRIIILDEGKVKLDFLTDEINKHIGEIELTPMELDVCDSKDVPFALDKDYLIEMSGVGFCYPDGTIPLKEIDLKITKGEKVVLIGKNGGGKSTLARLLVGLRKPSWGNLVSKVTKPRLVPQEADASFIENTVMEELVSQGIDMDSAKKILSTYGLERCSDHSPFEISGGQQRILAIASALASNPDLLVIDEPTAGLDNDHVNLILKMIENSNATIIHISHDNRIIDHSNRLIMVDSGKLLEKRCLK